MSTKIKAQLFLLVLILGFLAGPRAMMALQKFSPDDTPAPASPFGAQVVSYGTQDAGAQASKSASTSDPYDALHLSAKSVYVWDIASHQRLFGINEHAQLPLASVAKMMMAVVAKELLPKNSEITIAPEDILEEGDSGLYAGEKWAFEDLLRLTLVASSNDGASAIAGVAGATLMHASSTDPIAGKKLFIARMNQKARSIGLTSTYFLNESGLDVESLTSGAYGSARDMGMLFEYVFRKEPDLFTPTAYANLSISSENDVVHHVANTNKGVEEIAGIIGSKTGYTDLAGGNLVVVLDIGINHPVVIAVLGSTRDGRFTDVEQLINATVAKITGIASQQ